eukprot:gene9109-9278_t
MDLPEHLGLQALKFLQMLHVEQKVPLDDCSRGSSVHQAIAPAVDHLLPTVLMVTIECMLLRQSGRCFVEGLTAMCTLLSHHQPADDHPMKYLTAMSDRVLPAVLGPLLQAVKKVQKARDHSFGAEAEVCYAPSVNLVHLLAKVLACLLEPAQSPRHLVQPLLQNSEGFSDVVEAAVRRLPPSDRQQVSVDGLELLVDWRAPLGRNVGAMLQELAAAPASTGNGAGHDVAACVNQQRMFSLVISFLKSQAAASFLSHTTAGSVAADPYDSRAEYLSFATSSVCLP